MDRLQQRLLKVREEASQRQELHLREQQARQEVVQREIQAEVALEAQRDYLVECATQELRRRDEQSESIIQSLKSQLRQADTEVYERGLQEAKVVRAESGFRGKMRAHEEFHRWQAQRRVLQQELNMREELYQDALSQAGNLSDAETRGSSRSDCQEAHAGTYRTTRSAQFKKCVS